MELNVIIPNFVPMSKEKKEIRMTNMDPKLHEFIKESAKTNKRTIGKEAEHLLLTLLPPIK